MTLANRLRETAYALNEAYSDALGKKLVDAGLGKQLDELKNGLARTKTDLEEARLRIAQLETFMRIHGLNPDDANDTVVSGFDQGGDSH
jgi:hypothetical protein